MRNAESGFFAFDRPRSSSALIFGALWEGFCVSEEASGALQLILFWADPNKGIIFFLLPKQLLLTEGGVKGQIFSPKILFYLFFYISDHSKLTAADDEEERNV